MCDWGETSLILWKLITSPFLNEGCFIAAPILSTKKSSAASVVFSKVNPYTWIKGSYISPELSAQIAGSALLNKPMKASRNSTASTGKFMKQ